MLSFFNILAGLALVGLSLFIILLVLIQRTSGGLSSSLGGTAESAFGGQANAVLARTTIYCVVAFFILTFSSYLVCMAKVHQPKHGSALPMITAPVQPGSLTSVDVDSN